jgi:threonine dehydratase
LNIRERTQIAPADVIEAKRRLGAFLTPTPLRRSDWLSGLSGGDVYLKLETQQPTNSFKIRGALNFAIRHAAERPDVPVVTASAGNHGRALAFAAARLGLRAVVHAPASAPEAKLDAIRRLGADLRLWSDYDEAERQAKRHAADSGLPYLSPFSHPAIVAGAGTMGLEILEQLPEVDSILVPVGGGGLVSGIGIAAKAAGSVQIVGVEVEASHPFTAGLAAGRIVPIEVGPSLADGLVGNLDPDTITFEIARAVVDRFILVSESDIRLAIRDLLAEEHLVAEGAGAVGIAALLGHRIECRGRTVAVVVSGANIDRARLQAILG